MNYSVTSLENDTPKIILYMPNPKENLTTWGIFLSSLLLSIGGLFSMVMSSIRNSKCKNVKFCGFGCERELGEV
tara:strand:+ start:278 stop:499 length:222 start_codon:yes stop_codon:yes gene_type:complete